MKTAGSHTPFIGQTPLKRHQDRIRTGLVDIEQHLSEHNENHTGGRAFLHDSLRLLTKAHHAYARSGHANRRLANQAFYTRVEITEDKQLRPHLSEPFATVVNVASGSKKTKREPPTSFEVACSRKDVWVVPEVPNWNHMHRLERLDSAWIQGSPAFEPSSPLVFDTGFEVIENPSRRTRTTLTEKEVEAIRTAREGGESVVSIAKRFGIHRATVWEHTKA